MECDQKCPIDPVQLGKDMASLEKDMKELQRWQKKNWNYTRVIHKKVKIMSIVLRRHRLVFSGIASFASLSVLLAWELGKDWIKIKWKMFIGG